ncbi:unnamed protein product, partial [Ranitomeya imitator]
GHLNPEVVKYRQLCLKSQYKRYLTSQQQYFHNLLKQILASRKELLDTSRKKGPDLVMKRKSGSLRNSPEERERRAQRRYLKILRGRSELLVSPQSPPPRPPERLFLFAQCLLYPPRTWRR